MPLQFALRLICHRLEHSFSAGCHKYTVSMRACLHPSLIMLLERSNWCLKAQPLWKHLGWHRGILLFSLFPTLISQDICCWLCLEPDCLKFLKLSQLFICRGEMRRAISKAMSTSIGTLASIHEVRVYRRASRMPQPAGSTKTRLLVIIHYVCMTVLSCPAKDIAPMKTLPDARFILFETSFAEPFSKTPVFNGLNRKASCFDASIALSIDIECCNCYCVPW